MDRKRSGVRRGIIVGIGLAMAVAAAGCTTATRGHLGDAATAAVTRTTVQAPKSTESPTNPPKAPTTTQAPTKSTPRKSAPAVRTVAPPPKKRPVAGAALIALAALRVKGRAPMTGYSRDQFGPAWKDVDGNGCDTRDDILTRDLTAIARSGCEVTAGILLDPYTRSSIHFTRGIATSSAVQIDHVVALGNVWQTGGQQLSAGQREQLANDPLELLAVDGPTNQAKGAGDAATWLPPAKLYRCGYVARQVAVKARYHLWVTTAEGAAIARILAGCPGQRLPTSRRIPVPVVTIPPATTHAPTVAPRVTAPAPGGPVHYSNCAAVRAAGKAPLHTGDPGYRSGLDRDGDGSACE